MYNGSSLKSLKQNCFRVKIKDFLNYQDFGLDKIFTFNFRSVLSNIIASSS